MLNSIKIQNYRNLKQLSIEKLGRVNLIIGKNNTGKTSLLEAIYILMQQGLVNIIDSILTARQERYKSFRSINDEIEEISNLFYGREFSVQQERKIELIGTEDISGTNHQFSIRFVKYQEQTVDVQSAEIPKSVSNLLSKAYKIKTETSPDILASKIGLEISRNYEKYIRSFNENDVFDNMVAGLLNERYGQNTCHFVSASGVMNDTNLEKWWANIALTAEENIVIDALKIIENKIERISQIKEQQDDDARFVIKLLDLKKPIPLRSMGDGINHILKIVLAMVNCENGTLLIDEFENGLHYSVQEKLWEIIFYLATKLDIQVFATTHSNDTIRAFENIVNQNESNPLNGLLIKLENIDDNIESMFFEPDELKVITENLIEVRR